MKSKVNDLFSLKYYHASLSDEDLNSVKDSIDLNAKLMNSQTDEGWLEKCSTSFSMFLSNEDFKNHTGNTVIDVVGFTEIISKHFNEYLLALTTREQDVDLILKSAWMNKYEKGDAQEPHHHGDDYEAFSGCIFLSFDKEKDAKFCFHNRNMVDYNEIDYTASTQDTRLTNALLAESAICLDITQGDIILFSSSFWHSVEKQKESTGRTTLSFNFNVKPSM